MDEQSARGPSSTPPAASAEGRDDGGEVARRLKPDDQARVDGFLARGVNSVERKPFRPLLLLMLLVGVVAGLSLLSQWLAREAGVY